MIEALSGFPENTVALACKGHVTRDDYKKILEPRVHEALEKHEKIRLYYEIGEDFAGIEPGAVWEDFKVGMGHLNRWDRIAVVTDVHWIENTMKAFSFLLPGQMKIFPVSEKTKARDWISAA